MLRHQMFGKAFFQPWIYSFMAKTEMEFLLCIEKFKSGLTNFEGLNQNKRVSLLLQNFFIR